ncbi:biotin--protein ligase-like [Pecten maximus]|uniref:biotin--protein ligase-like n=1 Tax=Pecten maximus TaxID=6579 RepID=UPI001457F3CC|nr:biotin--protein ligase-like [Pecten maximus]
MTDPTRSTILVYLGEGACEENAEVVVETLKRHLNEKDYVFKYISPEETIEGNWKKSTALYVIGGGYDLGYIHALGDKGTLQVQQYVQEGGAYLGLCAGSYFGCDYIEFDKKGPQEVCGERILKFFPGLCVGPVWGPYNYGSESGARAALVDYYDKGTQLSPTTLRAYFNGGGMFLFYADQFLSVKRIPDQVLKKHCKESFKKEQSSKKEIVESKQKESGLKDFSDTEPEFCEEYGPEDLTHTLGVHRTEGEKGNAFCDIGTDLSKLPIEPNAKRSKIDHKKSEVASHTKHESDGSMKEKSVTRQVRSLNKNVEVLAVYREIEGQPAAIVKCHVGKGVAILSSPHIEYDSNSLNAEDKDIKKLIPHLVNSDTHEHKCFRSMLSHLGLTLSY